MSLYGLSVLFQGCSDNAEKSSNNKSTQSTTTSSGNKKEEASKSTPDPGSVDVGSGTGSLSGVVKFEGNAPNPQKFQVAKDPNTCGSGERKLQEVNVGSGGGLSGAVVYLEDVEGDREFEQPTDGYVIDQQGCHFVPHISIVPKGADVVIVNSDPVLHNIHTYQIMGRVRRSMFNIAQPEQNQKITKRMDPKNSNVIKVECDAHNFMHAWVFTADNPYYAETDASGNFSISDIPAGKYTVKAWNPTLDTQEQEVAVVGGKDNSITITLSK